MFFFFFFQAEDGIRDIGVTGVQTCALPISSSCATCSSARVYPCSARKFPALPHSKRLPPKGCRSTVSRMTGTPLAPGTPMMRRERKSAVADKRKFAALADLHRQLPEETEAPATADEPMPIPVAA